MFCEKCGNNISAESTFCSICGAKREGEIKTNFNITLDQSINAGMNYAGFWVRLVAFIIDAIIVGIAGGIVGFVLGFGLGLSMGANGANESEIAAAAGAVGYIAGVVINWLYFTLYESSAKQATIGKSAMGIIVTNLNSERITFGKANARYWGKIISGLILLIGFIMAGLTAKKQALHDIMAGTIVIKK